MKNVIVVPTHRSGLSMLENLLASFRGFDKYPLLIVVNDYREEDECLFGPLADKFRELPITLKTLASNSFEFGGLYVAHRETDCEELLLLPHSCEIVDNGLLDIVFQTHRGKSVAFGLQTGNWRTHGIGRKGENERLVLRHLDAAANRELLSLGDVRFWQGHIGKYRRAVLDKMRLEDYLPRNMIEAISKSELLFTSRYQALDRDTIVLFPKWVDGAAVEEKFGRKRLKVANKYLIKLTDERLAFVCVYIPAATRRLVGAMNEAFTGYGGDDDDFCRRVRKAGLKLAVTPLVSVKHGFGRRTWSASFSRVMSARRQARSMAEMLRLAAKIAEEER